ncbi:MAG: tRNA lysidine(34) synthetase TilS, partial [Bacteroidota bacterium]
IGFSPMLDQFKAHIDANYSSLWHQKVLVACSGGVDSMVLVALLRSCNLDFMLAHCNYKLRGKDSDEDEAFVVQLGKQHQIEVATPTIDLSDFKGSIQLMARERRYQWFQTLMREKNIPVLVTAHHANDNIETFFINLSRGTGIEGLTGIPSNANAIVRPLLPFSKAEILTYAEQHQIPWREDRSNAATTYVRNKLRHQVLPFMEELHPTFHANVLQTQQYLKLDHQLLLNYKKELKKRLFQKVEGGIAIQVELLQQLQPLDGYLYLLFNSYGFTQWDDLKTILTAETGKEIRSKSHRIIKHRAVLLLAPLPYLVKDQFLLQEGETLATPIKLTTQRVVTVAKATAKTIYVDKEKLNYPLILRKWTMGDYFYPLGMQGKKKVAKFFRDEQLSTLEKERQWLLCSGDAIIWIVGRRADDRFKVASKTRQILKIEWIV